MAKINTEKSPTGIPGFDELAVGGIPKHRTTLVAGTAGAGKTIFAVQWLISGITQYDEPGVFVTFEELSADLRRDVNNFGWDITQWEEEGKWRFVDVSFRDMREVIIAGDFDLGALMSRIKSAMDEIGAKRVAMDSISAIFSQFKDEFRIRNELLKITGELRRFEVTTVMTAERLKEYGAIARFGVEEYIADNVILLRNVLSERTRHRTIEIMKFRGNDHLRGERPFVIEPDAGIIVMPSFVQGPDEQIAYTKERLKIGHDDLDEMLGGGLYRGSVVLVSGATGTGKTLISSHFINEGLENGERCLLFALEESEGQVMRNTDGWSMSLSGHIDTGLLHIESFYPESNSAERHLYHFQELIETFNPSRIVIDSLSAFERAFSADTYTLFIVSLTSFIRRSDMTLVVTSSTPNLLSINTVTQSNVSTLTDVIILLRYVEEGDAFSRGITVLKMRGSAHSKYVYTYRVTDTGIEIGDRLENVKGTL